MSQEHTGKIHDKLNVKAEVMKQYAPNDIGRDIVARMAQMAVVIDSRATSIPRDLSFFNGRKWDRRSRL